MENIFNVLKGKTGWNSESNDDKVIIVKAKTKREVVAKTIIHAKTLGNSRIIIFDKDGKVSEERTIKKAIRKSTPDLMD